MKGDKQVIQHLNKILGNELVAINQYFLHAKMLGNMGFSKMSAVVRKESIDEMKHADMLAERFLQLDGLPNFQDLGRLQIGQTVEEMLQADLKLEEKAHQDLNEAIACAESTKDFPSSTLLKDILNNEVEHMDWIETQLALIKQVGLQNYLQSQIS